jgi:hypothetical protein
MVAYRVLMVVLGSGVNGWDDRTPARLSASLVPELPVGEPLVYVQPENGTEGEQGARGRNCQSQGFL